MVGTDSSYFTWFQRVRAIEVIILYNVVVFVYSTCVLVWCFIEEELFRYIIRNSPLVIHCFWLGSCFIIVDFPRYLHFCFGIESFKPFFSFYTLETDSVGIMYVLSYEHFHSGGVFH